MGSFCETWSRMLTPPVVDEATSALPPPEGSPDAAKLSEAPPRASITRGSSASHFAEGSLFKVIISPQANKDSTPSAASAAASAGGHAPPRRYVTPRRPVVGKPSMLPSSRSKKADGLGVLSTALTSIDALQRSYVRVAGV